MVERMNVERNQEHSSKRVNTIGLTQLPLIYPMICSGESVDLEGRWHICNIP